jgi:hypothetical protein
MKESNDQVRRKINNTIITLKNLLSTKNKKASVFNTYPKTSKFYTHSLDTKEHQTILERQQLTFYNRNLKIQFRIGRI